MKSILIFNLVVHTINALLFFIALATMKFPFEYKRTQGTTACLFFWSLCNAAWFTWVLIGGAS